MEKEKLLFIVSGYVEFTPKTGVQKKVNNQKKIFDEYFDVYLLGYSKNGVLVIHDNCTTQYQGNGKRILRNKTASELCKRENIKKCFIRNGTIDFSYVALIRKLHKTGVMIVNEMPTYPYYGELKGSIKNKLWLLIDFFAHHFVKYYTDRIATYSDDNRIYGVKCINISNGIDVAGNSVIVPDRDKNDAIHLIGVANVSDWHGFDRIIKGMVNYSGKRPVIFDIVGKGPAIPEYKKLVDQYNLADKVIFHGFKAGDALEEIYKKASIGVGSLGMHRLGLKSASSLKIREYASKGLPILAPNNLDTIPDNWPYLFGVTNDDEPVDIDEIVEQFTAVENEEGYWRKIRTFAETHFDMSITLEPIVSFLRSEKFL